jgi:hypothetical protein
MPNRLKTFPQPAKKRKTTIRIIILFIICFAALLALESKLKFQSLSSAKSEAEVKALILQQPSNPETDDNKEEVIIHQNRQVGKVKRICASPRTVTEEDDPNQCIFFRNPSIPEGCAHGNLEDPNVVEIPSWVANPLGKFYMYYSSSHSDLTIGGGSIASLGLAVADDLTGPWKAVNALSYQPSDIGCASLHSPDVMFDHEKQIAFMYVHAQECKSKSGMELPGQPSFVLVSTDGLNWVPPDLSSAPLLGEGFYPGMVSVYFYNLRVFKYGDSFYGVAKTEWMAYGVNKSTPQAKESTMAY